MALQGIEVEGVIIKEYPAKEGVSKTTNNPWKSQEFVIQTKDQYPRACLFRVFGADRIQQFNIHEGDAVHVWLDINARAWVSRFNFSGADQEKLCGVLSGGETNRLHLALTLKDEGNVLLLDEPTNDVDVNTIRALEEGLENFAGCAVVVCHDRWFLDRIATHILAFEGDSQVYFFEGNYQEYEENKKRRLGNVDPKPFKYKKLME